MGWEKSRVDTIKASGAKTMNGTLDNTLSVDASYPNNNGVDLAITGHGIIAGSKIVLPDITYYNGLRNIRAVSANEITIDTPEVTFEAAYTPAGTELWYAGFTIDQAWELIGFKVHLSSVGATDEDMEVTVDADAGAAWDWKVWDYSMLGKQDVIWTPPDIDALPMDANDILKFTYANTDTSTWGTEIMFRLRG